MQRLRGILERITPVEDLVTIEVIGHRQRNPKDVAQGKTSEWGLSVQDAAAVADFMVENGIKRDVLSIRGLADQDPLFPEKDFQGADLPTNRSLNERIEIILRKKRSST